MKITSNNTHNPEIEIINLQGELTGNGAIELQKYFYDRMDEGKRYHVINLKRVKKIDGLGINVLINAKCRGINLGLFNVLPEIKWMLMVSKNEGLFKIYNETHDKKVVSMFERDMLGKSKIKDKLKRRQSPRIDTCFQAEFKYHPRRNSIVACRANVLNLSEEGIFADNILAINVKSKKKVYHPEIDRHEIYDLKFKIEETIDFIETKGKCVKVFKTQKKLSASILFNDMKHEYKEMIRNYVCNNLLSTIDNSDSLHI